MSAFRNENEKMIWAAMYAAEYRAAYDFKRRLGGEISIPTCIEMAWSAVVEAREALKEVEDGWGAEDDVYLMLAEMVE